MICLHFLPVVLILYLVIKLDHIERSNTTMARGKRTPISEQIAKLDEQIADLEGKLKSLKEQKKTLTQKLKAEQLSELADIVETSGMSFEEVKKALSK